MKIENLKDCKGSDKSIMLIIIITYAIENGWSISSSGEDWSEYELCTQDSFDRHVNTENSWIRLKNGQEYIQLNIDKL